MLVTSWDIGTLLGTAVGMFENYLGVQQISKKMLRSEKKSIQFPARKKCNHSKT